MHVNRHNNAAYGNAFEQAIVNLINAEDWDCSYQQIDLEATREADPSYGCGILEFGIFPDDFDEVYSHAENAVRHIAARGLDIAPKARRVGEHTSIESCDVILSDNSEIEVKYVQKGRGTYYNTSMEMIADYFGFELYTDYLYSGGYYHFLEEVLSEFGIEINWEASSPIKYEDSLGFRKKHPEEARALREYEMPLRHQWVEEFYEHLLKTEQMSSFLDAMLSKDLSGKHTPEFFLVYNRSSSNPCSIVAANDIHVELEEEDVSSANSQCSIVFDTIRVTFAWQNGTGLNNPTIRVFLL